MKKIDLGQTVNTLANLGVIAGIVFLAFEIRQNNELLELESLRTFNDRAIGALDLQMQNPWITELLLKDPKTLNPMERVHRSYMAERMFLMWEEQFEEIQAGRRRPEELIESWRLIYWDPDTNFLLHEFWEDYRPRASAEFGAFVDANIVAPGPR